MTANELAAICSIITFLAWCFAFFIMYYRLTSKIKIFKKRAETWEKTASMLQKEVHTANFIIKYVDSMWAEDLPEDKPGKYWFYGWIDYYYGEFKYPRGDRPELFCVEMVPPVGYVKQWIPTIRGKVVTKEDCVGLFTQAKLPDTTGMDDRLQKMLKEKST